MTIQAEPKVRPFVPRAPATTDNNDRYLVFLGLQYGQGAGNIMNGLLATHLLGYEFDRTVCLTATLHDFLIAFEPIDEATVHNCPTLKGHLPPVSTENSISLVNFRSPPNECALKERLASNVEILYIESNTYPRWPPVPDNFFFRYYRPRKVLLDALPFDAQSPPPTVVHLRMQDGDMDKRKGLDDQSRSALGDMLPRTTYLVTNRVPWFDWFAEKYGWAHPNWQRVKHSALDDNGHQEWGSRAVPTEQGHVDQNLQIWADWYAILRAKYVVHTHSDFSLSAIHWMNIPSRTILDYNPESGTVDLTEESWRVDGETAPLIERTLEAVGTQQLRLCVQSAKTIWIARRVDTPRLQHP